MGGMSWESSFESQIHAFGPHQSNIQGDDNIGSPDPTQQISTYQSPQSPNAISQFNNNNNNSNMDRGQQQHEAVFLPFETPQPFNPGGFQTDTFMQNAVPLQDYISQ
jgi:hypothetical protein